MSATAPTYFTVVIIQFTLTNPKHALFLAPSLTGKERANTHLLYVQWFEFSKVLGRLSVALSRCILTVFQMV